ncbi:DNA primase DnaG [Nanoarchaeota archaeon]
MGKISPVSIKYTIYAKFTATGPVEKPDVIGAIFGQTEGLLGEDLELRELQKNGKIGRIEVETTSKDSKSTGMIEIPTSLDKTETTIIGAAIETIDRIGPCTAKVEIDKIEDVRGGKRDYVMQRAKALLEKMGTLDTREMHLEVSSSARVAKIQEYGDEKLPAGPDMDNVEIIVVEGRADVVNLLKYGIKNVIAMNGASLPKTISELSKERQLTIFLDGDRGGDLILKDATANAKVEFVARAPSGQEVEELTGKEILTALRAKLPVKEYLESSKKTYSRGRPSTSERSYPSRGRSYGNRDDSRGRYGNRDDSRGRYDRDDRPRRTYRSREANESFNEKPVVKDTKPVPAASAKEIAKLKEVMSEVDGTNGALLLDKELNILRKVSGTDIGNATGRSRIPVYAVVFGGNVTNPIIRATERSDVKRLVAKNFSSFDAQSVELISL